MHSSIVAAPVVASASQIDAAKRDLMLRSGAGLSLPVAGALYWIMLGVAGFFLPVRLWIALAFLGSGLIYPLGLMLARPLKANLMIRGDPLNSLAIKAVIAINLLWPVYFAIARTAPEVVPLSLAIGMGLHWPIFAWLYDSRACMVHAWVRVAAVALVWFAFPQGRLTWLPLTVAAAYAMSIVMMRRELAVAGVRKRTEISAAV